MKETLITFKTAKLAKESGFNEGIIECYNPKGIINEHDSLENIKALHIKLKHYLYVQNDELGEGYISAPTQSLLQKWLREKHNINVIVNIRLSSLKFKVRVYKKYSSIFMSGFFSTYELALEEGLIKALNLIKKDE